MRDLLGTRTLAALVSLAIVSIAARSRAQSATARGGRTEAEACFDAAERAQPLMKERKLRAAQRELQACVRDACPRAARSDCRRWLDEVSRALPTILVRARTVDAEGGDAALDDVRVSVDGEAAAPRAGDDVLPVDPGAHTLRFEHDGFPPVERRLELREGEARRVVDVVFRAPDAEAPSPAAVAADQGSAAATPSETPLRSDAPPKSEHAASMDRPVPGLVWGLLGGGAIALGAGAYFEVTGLSSRSNLVETCRPTRSCAQSDVDAARNQVLTGDILVGAGALLLAGAAYVYFTRGPASGQGSGHASGWRVLVAPLAGGAAAALEGSL
jgi:hypothetical protein